MSGLTGQTPWTCVGVHYWDARGVIKVFADGHVETQDPSTHYGDLVTLNQPPSAPVGGVQWHPNGRGYLVWLTDGNVFNFGD